MYDAGGTVIYVGKAEDLKFGFSYFRSNLASQNRSAGRPRSSKLM